MKTYTVDQIKIYLESVDSFGDTHYFCDEEHIDKAIEEAQHIDEIEPEHGDID
jgi:hypothetical protein